jgi:type 1 fimbria pilin
MLFSTKIRRVVMVAALALPLAACDNDPTGGEEHADVSAVRLTVGAQSVTVNSQGTQTGTLTVPQGASNVTVTWLDDDGDAITEFEEELTLQVAAVAGTTGVTFVASSRTAGVLTATSAGQKSLRVSLLHDDHPDFAQNVTITVS